MDRRLPHRIGEARQRLSAGGRPCDSESVRGELVRAHPEYARIKALPLKRLIAQELSAPPPSSEAPAVADAGGAAAKDAGRRAKRRRKGASGAEAGAAEAQGTEAAPAEEPPEVTEAAGVAEAAAPAMNGSIRRLYAGAAPPAQGADAGGPERPAGAKRAARERAAMAAARRQMGLGDDARGPGGAAGAGGGFAPEPRPAERLEDLGGVDKILAELRQLVVQPLTHPEVFSHLGVQPPTGVLLHGPPGSGKTKLAHALAGTTGVSFFKVAATEIVSGMSGESEAKIRQLFQAAISAAPSLLFMDEVDAITPKRESAGREMERRIVAQLLTCMDELQNTNVVVLACTNRPDALDPALRRAGRFDREIGMGIPDEPARRMILEKMTAGMRLSGDLDVAELARLTPGYVGADLSALSKEAALVAVARAFAGLGGEGSQGEPGSDAPARPYTQEEMAGLSVEMADFRAALSSVQPSARREGFTTVPDVSWGDVGALSEVRADMDAAICEPIRKAGLFRQLGLTVPCGVLLFGPPGCGKTLVAKAAANASGANFISVKGPELLNKYVGESERAVRLVFQRAASSSPCVIFFDELDALVPRRSSEGSSSSERVVNQMLTEMDGVQARSQVYVIAATNRPDIVDPAMLRPGRLDRLLFVPLPCEEGRLEILQAHFRRLPLAEDVDLRAVARGADGFSGADLASLAREAAMLAIRAADTPAATSGEGEAPSLCISSEIMARARARVAGSVSAKERREYEALASRLCGPRLEPAAPAEPAEPAAPEPPATPAEVPRAAVVDGVVPSGKAPPPPGPADAEDASR